MISVLVPTFATGWLVRELVRDEEQRPAPVMRSAIPSPPLGAPTVAEPVPERPDELQSVRRASEPTLDRAAARELVQDAGSGTGSRYLALRRLESLSSMSPAGLQEAEALVLTATDMSSLP